MVVLKLMMSGGTASWAGVLAAALAAFGTFGLRDPHTKGLGRYLGGAGQVRLKPGGHCTTWALSCLANRKDMDVAFIRSSRRGPHEMPAM